MLTQIRFNMRLDNDIFNIISRDSDSRLCGHKRNAGGPKEVIYNKYFCDFQSNRGAKLHVMSSLFPICRPYPCSAGWPWRSDSSKKEDDIIDATSYIASMMSGDDTMCSKICTITNGYVCVDER